MMIDSAWNACVSEPFSPLRWIECHPGLAGYVQAVGTIAALVIALASPAIAAWYARRAVAADRRERTLHLVKMLANTVLTVEAQATKISARLRTTTTPPSALDWDDFWNTDIFLPRPPDLEFLIRDTDLISDLIEPHRHLVRAIEAYNAVRFQIKNFGVGVVGQEWDNLRGNLGEALQPVLSACTLIAARYYPPK